MVAVVMPGVGVVMAVAVAMPGVAMAMAVPGMSMPVVSMLVAIMLVPHTYIVPDRGRARQRASRCEVPRRRGGRGTVARSQRWSPSREQMREATFTLTTMQAAKACAGGPHDDFKVV